MSVLYGNNHRFKRPPPWQWGQWGSLTLQMLLAVLLAAGALFLFTTFLPDTARVAQRVLYVTFHEGSHALAALLEGGQVSELVIRPDGSGEALVISHDRALTAASGPVGPAWLAAMVILLGFIRAGNSALLLAIGITLYLIAHFYGEDIRVFWALIGWAALTGLVGFAPTGPLIKSATVLVFGFALALGVLDALPYLSIEEVETTAASLAQAMPAEAGVVSEISPSDVRIVATAMGAEEIIEARRFLIGLMIFGAMLSTFALTNFILRHRL